MKRTSIFFIFFCFSLIKSQDLVEFSMGTGYQYDIYYSFEEGITAFPERVNWELAFSTDSSNNNIRINSGNGVTLFQVSESIEDWDQVTSMSSNSIQLRNSNLYWDIGAFVSNPNNDTLNNGWGTLTSSSPTIDGFDFEGSRIYIINYGTFSSPISKKIKINNLINGIFDFTIANLDGSNEEPISIDTQSYLDKTFIYYSLLNNEIIDREPSNWDILFTKYEEDLDNNPTNPFYYLVTGALTKGNSVAEYNGFLDFNPMFDELNFSTEINTVGYDWKTYSGGYTIVSDRAYFIQSQDQQSLYKIIFQSFDGQQTGNMSFLVEDLNFNPIHLTDHDSVNFSIYPNPSKDSFKINFSDDDAFLKITDLNGRLIYQKMGPFNNTEINHLNNGHYIVTVITNDDIFAKQFIVNK